MLKYAYQIRGYSIGKKFFSVNFFANITIFPNNHLYSLFFYL